MPLFLLLIISDSNSCVHSQILLSFSNTNSYLSSISLPYSSLLIFPPLLSLSSLPLSPFLFSHIYISLYLYLSIPPHSNPNAFPPYSKDLLSRVRTRIPLSANQFRLCYFILGYACIEKATPEQQKTFRVNVCFLYSYSSLLLFWFFYGCFFLSLTHCETVETISASTE